LQLSVEMSFGHDWHVMALEYSKSNTLPHLGQVRHLSWYDSFQPLGLGPAHFLKRIPGYRIPSISASRLMVKPAASSDAHCLRITSIDCMPAAFAPFMSVNGLSPTKMQ
jgi:hypothetical protein